MRKIKKSKWFVAALVIVGLMLTGCGQDGQQDEQKSVLSIVTFQMEPSSDGVEDFVERFGDFIERIDDYSVENGEHYYNIVPGDISNDYGFSIFKSDLSCCGLLVYDDKIYPLGEFFGGYGVNSFALADLNEDGKFELYFTFSWGSGIPRSQVGYFDTASKETVIFDYEDFFAISFLEVDSNSVLCVYNANCEVKSFVDIEMSAGDKIKIATIVADNGMISLVEE